MLEICQTIAWCTVRLHVQCTLWKAYWFFQFYLNIVIWRTPEWSFEGFLQRVKWRRTKDRRNVYIPLTQRFHKCFIFLCVFTSCGSLLHSILKSNMSTGASTLKRNSSSTYFYCTVLQFGSALRWLKKRDLKWDLLWSERNWGFCSLHSCSLYF